MCRPKYCGYEGSAGKSSLVPIAEAGSVTIYAPSSRWIVSFFSSPYTPHIMGRAIDITTSYIFGDDALSPIEGVVEKIARVEAGPGPFELYDYVLLVRCGRLWAKLMHIKPAVSVNERIHIGDAIGRYIRTNFFSFYHLPHIHIEIHRDRSLRPSRALPLYPTKELLSLAKDRCVDAYRVNVLELRVVDASDSYTLFEPVNGALCISTRVGSCTAIVNGDVTTTPSYLGLIHIDGTPKPNTLVRVLGAAIGYTRRICRGYSIAVNTRLSFREWLYRFSSIGQLYSSKRSCGEVFEVRIDVDGARKSLELLIGTLSCIKVDGVVERSRAILRIDSVRRHEVVN